MRSVQHRLTQPVRRTAVPVLNGTGRGLRVQFGESTLARAFKTVEGRVETAIIGELADGKVFYDVGANIGWYSLLAARVVGPGGRVLAFEPSLSNASLAQHNASVNRFANVTVVCAALTDEDGWLTFLDKGNLQGRLDKDDFEAQAEFRAKRDQRVLGRSPVPVARLDSWLEQTGQPVPDVVKIEVEGAELGVLRGMARTIAASGPTLVIELHRTSQAVADFLDAAGYEHAPIEFAGPTREAPPLVHVLARPAGSGATRHHGG
jgi:FkbM family methyltransferase